MTLRTFRSFGKFNLVREGYEFYLKASASSRQRERERRRVREDFFGAEFFFGLAFASGFPLLGIRAS